MSDDHVSELVESIVDPEERARFAPVVAFEDDQGVKLLADGFHRAEAWQQAGLETIPCEIRKGSRRDAILFAAGVNADHGLKRTHADKEKAVRALLADPEWAAWSDNSISKAARVSNHFVAKVKERLTWNVPSEDDSRRTYTTKHGTTSTMDTTRLKKPKAPDETAGDQANPEPTATPPPTTETTGPSPPPRSKPARPKKAEDDEEAYQGRTKDDRGNHIPDNLRGVFSDTTIAEAIATLERWLETIRPSAITEGVQAKAKFFPFMRFPDLTGHLAAMLDEGRRTVETLQAAEPYAVCPACQGKRCEHCRRSGYCPRWRYEELLGQIQSGLLTPPA